FDGQPPGILHVATVDAEHQRPHAPLWLRDQIDLTIGLKVDAGRLLALAQIGYSLLPQVRRRAIGHPAAGTAAVEPEHKPRLLRRTTVHERINAQRAVQAGQFGRLTLDIVEARPPDQRSVAEDPEFVVNGHRGAGVGLLWCSRNSPAAAMQRMTGED